MGVLYLATPAGQARKVALKLMSPALDEPAFRGRFEREARTLARLYSPYVVSVHDFGEHDGWLYLTTPYLPLGDLAGHIAAHLLGPGEALRLLSHAATGLAAAHAAGILHRDIKPSNILLAQDPDGLRALIADFGIARDAQAPAAEVTAGVIGTYAYMPPERFRGEPADARTDVYALGCVLWAMLYGRPPYVDAAGQLLMREVLDAPPPVYAGPSAAPVNQILGRCLAKAPADRFADAGELLAALTGIGEIHDAPATVLADQQAPGVRDGPTGSSAETSGERGTSAARTPGPPR
jgi:serine/threonine-protein kinase